MKRWTLREARDRRELNQVQLAALSGVEQSNISAIERGVVKQPEISTMDKLGKALNMTALLSVSGLVFEEKS